MPQTITEKIIAAHSNQPQACAGDLVIIRPVLIIMSERTGFTSMRALEDMGVDRLHDPSRVVVVDDHTVQGAATAAPIVDCNLRLRTWAAAQGIGRFYDAG